MLIKSVWAVRFAQRFGLFLLCTQTHDGHVLRQRLRIRRSRLISYLSFFLCFWGKLSLNTKHSDFNKQDVRKLAQWGQIRRQTGEFHLKILIYSNKRIDENKNTTSTFAQCQHGFEVLTKWAIYARLPGRIHGNPVKRVHLSQGLQTQHKWN